MNPRLKELYYSKIQTDLAKKLSLKNKLMGPKFKKVVINMMLLLFKEKLPSISVIFDLFCSLMLALSLKKILRRDGRRVNEIINDINKPKVIIQPKSIIGLISLTTNERKAKIVVKTV